MKRFLLAWSQILSQFLYLLAIGIVFGAVARIIYLAIQSAFWQFLAATVVATGIKAYAETR